MSSNKLDDLNLTTDEVSNLKKAFKDENFRKLFAEYAEEISDPENKKKYEEEIAMLENERGMDVKFVKPEPGHVIKTTTLPDNVKAFLNICKNGNIEEARCNRQHAQDGKSGGLHWSIPHSFAPIREDIDKQGKTCKVFDFVIHPNTYRMAETNIRFMKMIDDTAMSGVEKQFGITLDKKNFKKPKITFKGTPTATVIRTRKEGSVTEMKPDDILSQVKYPYSDKTSEEKTKEQADKVARQAMKKGTVDNSSEKEDEYQKPTYVLKHRSNIDLQNFTAARDSKPSTRPIELCVEIDLPLLKSAASVGLDIFEKKLQLCSEKVAKYKLDLDLPYEVDESNGSAKFDKAKRKLVVTLPVVPLKVSEVVANGSLPSSDDNKEPREEPMVDFEAVTSGDQPLIEILSSEDCHDREGTDAANASSENSSEEVDHAQQTQDNGSMEPGEKHVSDIFYAMPPFDYLQDDETVTFILDVKNVKRESVKNTFISKCDKHFGVDIKVKSVGPGGFPMHFRFVVQFLETNTLDKGACYFDVSDHNLVATLIKTDDSIGPWQQFFMGQEKEKLEEKMFLSEHFVKRQLNGLDKEHGECKDQSGAMPELEVTDMNTSQLLLDIKERHGSSMSESAEEIEVVHAKLQPKLQGILKQRSRTTSESSDDILSSSYNRQYSTGGESSPTPLTEESEEDLADNNMKKSVSFSEEVDQTLYKVNQSVTSMRSSLKNKRKKAQKKEKKQAHREKKRDARRRRNSNSLSEPSSDDPTTPDCIEDGRLAKEQVKVADDVDDVSGTDQPQDTIRGGKSTGRSDQNGVEVTESEGVATVKGTSSQGISLVAELGCDNVSRVNSVHNTAAAAASGKDDNDDERTCDSDDDGEINDNGEIHSGGVQPQQPGSGMEATQAKQKVDTLLSWNDTPSAEPRPQCAFEFSNSVMFELDLD